MATLKSLVMDPIRINKFLSERGFSTRKGADLLIEKGRVFVNGKRAVLGQKVTKEDLVEIKDNTKKQFRYILYYKPRGVITHSPGENEVDIQTRVYRDHKMQDVFPIGRLDKDSEGLILLTNDGRITERILNPSFGHERSYRVTVDKRVTQTFLNRLSRGVSIEGYFTKPAQTELVSEDEYTFAITLTEGKKHQIRRMCAALGYQVTRLVRTRIMHFSLKNLKPGNYHELTEKEILFLKKTLRLK